MEHSSQESTSPRVLVVDDEPVIRDLLQVVLGSAGYQVVCLESGRQALKRLREEPFDALVCDQGLADLDGISLHRSLVQEGHPLASRMIFMTGDLTDEAVERFLQETGLPALRKPFELSRLEELLEELTACPEPPGAHA